MGKLITVYTKIFLFLLLWSCFHFQSAEISLRVASILSRLIFCLYSEPGETFSALRTLFGNYRKLRCRHTGKYYAIALFLLYFETSSFFSFISSFHFFHFFFFTVFWFSTPLLLFVSHAFSLLHLASKYLSALLFLFWNSHSYSFSSSSAPRNWIDYSSNYWGLSCDSLILFKAVPVWHLAHGRLRDWQQGSHGYHSLEDFKENLCTSISCLFLGGSVHAWEPKVCLFISVGLRNLTVMLLIDYWC